MTGDRRPDVIVGAPQASSGDDTDAGMVLLFVGTPTGLDRGSPRRLAAPAGAAGRFGASVACLEATADRPGVIFVGSPGASSTGARYGGALTAFVLTETGELARPAVALDGSPTPMAALGSALATADVDGDGAADLVVGALGTTPDADHVHAGDVLVFLGIERIAPNELGASSLSSPLRLNAAPRAFERFGSALAMGDVEGDGRADVIVGTALADGSRGRVTIHCARRTGSEGAQRLALETTACTAPSNTEMHTFGFGAAVAAADTDGDGRAEILIGQPNGSPPSVHVERTSR